MSSSTFLVAVKNKNRILIYDKYGKPVTGSIDNQKILLCHKKRFGEAYRSAADILELYAFVKPAHYVNPTIKSLCKDLNLAEPNNVKKEALSLYAIMDRLLDIMDKDPETVSIAKFLASNNWDFGESVAEKLDGYMPSKHGLNIFPLLSDVGDVLPPVKFGAESVSEDEAIRKLHAILPKNREIRNEQEEYVRAISHAFTPGFDENEPNFTAVEAGTGVGKTLGYLAAAACYAFKNNASVWISTYTKNLQQQLNREISYLFDSENEKRRFVTIRKGRENYLCLLNFEELLTMPNMINYKMIGLMARWILHTEDGDLTGDGFPSWMFDIFDQNVISILSDKRFECLYSACPYYRKCFIEKSIRKADSGTFVITNHALAMSCAASGLDEPNNISPLFYLFDEGHHLFNAADSTFSANFSLNSCSELRRWIIGTEDGARRTRLKGLIKRTEKVTTLFPEIKEFIDLIVMRAGIFPKTMTLARIKGGIINGTVEKFFANLRQLVLARNIKNDDGYSLECELVDLPSAIITSAREVGVELTKILEAVSALETAIEKLINEHSDIMESAERLCIESLQKTIKTKIVDTVSTWKDMLNEIGGNKRQGIIDFFEITRNQDGNDTDLCFQRRLVDPTIAFAECLKSSAAGIAVTSATLKDKSSDEIYNQLTAKRLSGGTHFQNAAPVKSISSPFNYAEQTRIIVVNDINKSDIIQVSAAFTELFKASRGGALGLFTSIRRLKTAYAMMKNKLGDAGIELLAQHVTRMTNSSLMDIFKSDEDSCLLGTDAMRDGVDVPGKSLRMVVFDRIPWEKPTIVHRIRREVFGKDFYDRSLVRMKLIQAYGRLIRRSDDKGVFVILDKAAPSNIMSAFPKNVPIIKTGLKDAVTEIASFFS